MTTALEHWAAQLQAWAIPEPILAAAPVSPWGFDVTLFSARVDRALQQESPSRREAVAALPEGGTVLDVGCGAGAGSMPLADRATTLVGVDPSEAMLAAFAEQADRFDVVAARTVQGSWPDAADDAALALGGRADVVVCHHVLHNIADLAPFVEALDAGARHRVVVEVSDGHPLAWTAPYWRAVHGIDRPAGPTAADLEAALGELGRSPIVERFDAATPWRSDDPALVAFLRQRLCLPAALDDQVRDLIDAHGVTEQRPLATLSWVPHLDRAERGTEATI